jgi:transcriptional regulator with XRE-family HTH domain
MPKADEELRRAFADRVSRLREAKGLSWKELAAKVGTNVSSLSRWGRTRTGPRMESIVALSLVLGVTTDYLLTGRGPVQLTSADVRLSTLKEAIEQTPRVLREALAGALLGQPAESAVHK